MACRQRKTKLLIAKRNTETGSGVGEFRYVVEAAFDWLFNQRRLRVRCEKRDDIHQAFFNHRMFSNLLATNYGVLLECLRLI